MLRERFDRDAARLSDEQLARAIVSMECCARCFTRTRREVALMRLRCLRCEQDRRAMGLRAGETSQIVH